MCDITNSEIYLLDNLGVSNQCVKTGDKYVCTNIMYGKTPVLNTSKCVWEFCDTDINTGEIDFNSCKETSYPFYVESQNGGCIIKRIDDPTYKDTMKNNCCCNTDSLCDYTNCCDQQPIEQCEYRDFQDKFFNETYFVKPGKFACVNLECIEIPPDYDNNEDRYPGIKKSIEQNGVFNSNLCNCVKNKDSCKNTGDCQPILGCYPCISGDKGSYSCVIGDSGDYSCVKDDDGNYHTIDDCNNDCFKTKRWECNNSGCVENKKGDYYSETECKKICLNLAVNSVETVKHRTIKAVSMFLTAMLFILLVFILFVVFNKAKK